MSPLKQEPDIWYYTNKININFVFMHIYEIWPKASSVYLPINNI